MSDEHKAAMTVVERHDTQAMSPVVAAGLRILEHSPSPDTLRELLAVQQVWEANEARKAYSAALVGLKRDLPTVIARDKTVAFGDTRYTHASLAGVMEAITEPLTSHGFSLAWTPSTSKDGVSVTCRLTHSAGHSETATITAPPDTGGRKSAPQAIASTITLLQRYTALSLLGISTADMVDPEPAEPDPDTVDSSRNLKAVGWLSRQGRTCQQAESFLDKPVDSWNAADLDRLKAWAKESAQ